MYAFVGMCASVRLCVYMYICRCMYVCAYVYCMISMHVYVETCKYNKCAYFIKIFNLPFVGLITKEAEQG